LIVTVTLNTAIDKTLSVPNFRLGRRPPARGHPATPPGAGLSQRAKDWFTRPIVLLFATAFASASVLVARRLRRGPGRRRATRSEPEAA